MSQIVNIVSGGRLGDQSFFREKIADMKNCLIICCDGGTRHVQSRETWNYPAPAGGVMSCNSREVALLQGASGSSQGGLHYLGIKPDVIIGDMDSIDPALLASYSTSGIEIIKHPANKDFTDTELALDYALSLKPEAIFIWGALGGRIDHALANVFLLCKGQEKGIRTCLIDEYGEAFVLDKETAFINETGKTVSLIALSPEVTGINLMGFLYPLKDGTLAMGQSRGISNIINEDRARISVKYGKLLVIKYWQKDIFPEAV